MRKRLMLIAGALAGMMALVSMTGCDNQPPKPKANFASTDVTGIDYAKGFELTDHTGQKRTLADYRGKAVVVFFGFTHCPDVCPTTLAELAAVKKELGADGDKLQVLFITVDPERDTQQALADFVPAFDPGFVGLYGTPEQTAKLQQDYKLFVQKVKNKTGDSYNVDHTAGSYVYDPQGRIRLFMRSGQGPQAVLNDLKLILAGA